MRAVEQRQDCKVTKSFHVSKFSTSADTNHQILLSILATNQNFSIGFIVTSFETHSKKKHQTQLLFWSSTCRLSSKPLVHESSCLLTHWEQHGHFHACCTSGKSFSFVLQSQRWPHCNDVQNGVSHRVSSCRTHIRGSFHGTEAPQHHEISWC